MGHFITKYCIDQDPINRLDVVEKRVQNRTSISLKTALDCCYAKMVEYGQTEIPFPEYAYKKKRQRTTFLMAGL